MRGAVVSGGWVPGEALPDRLRGSRWAVAPRHVAVIAGVLLTGLLWAVWSLGQARPEPVPDSGQPVGTVSGSPVAQPGDHLGDRTVSGAPGRATASPQVVVVHVAGKVRRPGLVRATPGARIAEVLAAAGGALPGTDVTGLNLARPVTDGEQILVGVSGGATTGPPSSPPGPSGSPTAGPVDLNTATLAQLEGLPGVGPVLAQRILDWRIEHGRFSSVDELQEVSGVGEKKFASLRPHVRV